MMGNLELQGELAGLRRTNMALDIRADATIRAVKQIFNRGAITCPVEDLDIEGAASLVAELIEIKGEKIRNLGTIKRIEKEIS
jgi:hypothetical protein